MRKEKSAACSACTKEEGGFAFLPVKQSLWWMVSAVSVMALSGCGAGDEDGPDPSSPGAPRLVGRIASVHEKEGFALVENFGNLKLGEGLLLSTRGSDERTATLVVSGERLGRFAAADLKSGDVAAGDSVYARPMSAGEPSTDLEVQQSIERTAPELPDDASP